MSATPKSWPVDIFEVDSETGQPLPEAPPAVIARRPGYRSILGWQWALAAGLLTAATAVVIALQLPWFSLHLTLRNQTEDQGSDGSTTLAVMFQALARLDAWGHFRVRFESTTDPTVTESGQNFGNIAVLLIAAVVLSVIAALLLLSPRTTSRRCGAFVTVLAAGTGIVAVGDVALNIRNIFQQLTETPSARYESFSSNGLWIGSCAVLLMIGLAIVALRRTRIASVTASDTRNHVAANE